MTVDKNWTHYGAGLRSKSHIQTIFLLTFKSKTNKIHQSKCCRVDIALQGSNCSLPDALIIIFFEKHISFLSAFPPWRQFQHLFVTDRNRQKAETDTLKDMVVGSVGVSKTVKTQQPRRSNHSHKKVSKYFNSCTCSLSGSSRIHQVFLFSFSPPPNVAFSSIPVQGGGVQHRRPVGHEIGARFDRLFLSVRVSNLSKV